MISLLVGKYTVVVGVVWGVSTDRQSNRFVTTQ